MLFAKIDPYAKMINGRGYLCLDLEWKIDQIIFKVAHHFLQLEVHSNAGNNINHHTCTVYFET